VSRTNRNAAPVLRDMKLAKNISGSLIVIVAAGAFTVGALFVEPDDGSSSSAAPVAPTSAAETSSQGRYGNGTANDTTNAAAGASIEISDFEISAARVAPGATVTVVNRDDTAHTVSARDGSFSTGTIRAGASVTFVAPEDAGSYAVFCEIHPSMRSTLTVG
jgi:plastocyanin